MGCPHPEALATLTVTKGNPMSSDVDDADGRSGEDATAMQPLRDGDTSVEPDPAADPAQAEWERTADLDDATAGESPDGSTATGRDPAELPSDDDDIPASDLPGAGVQPETQGTEPLDAEIGDEGQGDLALEDL